jgi:beta-mannosidase
MELFKQSLSTGWTFRDRDAEDWMSVPAVPSVVQQDLIANQKYASPLRDPTRSRFNRKTDWKTRSSDLTN